jgi:hypothetical protein
MESNQLSEFQLVNSTLPWYLVNISFAFFFIECHSLGVVVIQIREPLGWEKSYHDSKMY